MPEPERHPTNQLWRDVKEQRRTARRAQVDALRAKLARALPADVAIREANGPGTLVISGRGQTVTYYPGSGKTHYKGQWGRMKLAAVVALFTPRTRG